MHDNLKKVCGIEDVSLNPSKSFNIEGRDILITNCEDAFFATDLKCTHANLSLE
ncbi:MAG: Rieske (2Fe-2S) protein [Patescibacteria group bacterium]